MASLLTVPLPVITVVVFVNVDDLGKEMRWTLLFLGIACTIATIFLGGIGKGAAADGSELRSLSTFAVVVGVIEFVGMLAFTLFAYALGKAAEFWFQPLPTFS